MNRNNSNNPNNNSNGDNSNNNNSNENTNKKTDNDKETNKNDGKSIEDRNYVSLISGCLCSMVIILIVLIAQIGGGNRGNYDIPQHIRIGDSVIHDPISALVLNLSTITQTQTPAVSNIREQFAKLPKKTADVLSFTEFIQVAKRLQERIDDSLSWILRDTTAQTTLLRWDLIANADVHIMYKIKLFLAYYLNNEDNQQKMYSLFSNGYQCSNLHAAQQELISKFINMDICSEVEWYKLVHLTFPEAKTIFDVGGNKGYLGSLFLTLWGGGKLKSSPLDLFHISKSLNTWKNSRNPGGYCRDGFNQAIALYCPNNAVNRNHKTGHCDIVNEDVRIRSFDGSSYLRNTITGFIENHLFPLTDKNGKEIPENKNYRQIWQYFHHAVSNKEGVARFTKQSNEKNAGFEGGSLKTNVQSAAKQNKKIILDENGENVGGGGGADVNANQKLLAETEEVSVITIDTYLEKNHIQQLDMLKIDTEGNDNKVLLGANKAITSLTGVFTFEGGGGVTYSKDMDEMYNTLGYNCYSTSRAGLFKWNANCMKERYFGSFRKKDKGNIFCVHRKRAPLTALAFDILSFPAMIDFLFLHKNTSTTAKNGMNEAEKLAYQTLFENAVKSEEDGEMKLNMKADPTSVLPLYINIHGFCRPWPSCLSNL